MSLTDEYLAAAATRGPKASAILGGGAEAGRHHLSGPLPEPAGLSGRRRVPATESRSGPAARSEAAGGGCEGCGGFTSAENLVNPSCNRCGGSPQPFTATVPVLPMEDYREQLIEVWLRAELPERARQIVDVVRLYLAWDRPDRYASDFTTSAYREFESYVRPLLDGAEAAAGVGLPAALAETDVVRGVAALKPHGFDPALAVRAALTGLAADAPGSKQLLSILTGR